MDAASRFRALFDEAYPALRRYAHHRGLSWADADDLVAEVLTIAWRRLDAVPLDDPIPWLFAVSRNVWRNHTRSMRRHTRMLDRLPPPAAQLPDEPDDGSEVARVRAAFISLEDADREVLALVAWDELTSEQLAAALECSPGAARVRLHRARSRLADALAAEVPATGELVTSAEERTYLHRVSKSRRGA